MKSGLDSIEIPLVNQLENTTDPLAFADYILGQLVSNAPAIIESSLTLSADGNVDWKISTVDNKTTVTAASLRRRYRHILARIGHHYMDDQLYCGFTNRILKQGEHHALCYIYMGNCGDTGFWFRAYSRALNAG